MNLPNFDINRVALNPNDPDYITSVIAEEKRVCGAIDERIDSLAEEFINNIHKARELTLSLETTSGFFARWGIRRRLKSLGRRLSDNMAMRNELITARWRRTYGA